VSHIYYQYQQQPRKMLDRSLKFRVSAPGKVILHGEHSVVYGKAALAGPINLRTYFYCKAIDEPVFKINYENLEYNCMVTLDNLNQFLKDINCFNDIEPPMFLYKLREKRDFIYKYVTHDKDYGKIGSSIEMAVGVTMFLLNRILKSEGIKEVTKGCKIDINSEISIGAGLGSSASYGVCISAGCYVITQLLKGHIDAKSINEFKFNTDLLAKISQWAFDSEVIMHEKPSGIDNTIATYGDIIKFCKGQEPEIIHLKKPLNIMIADTAITRSTSRLVAHVAQLHETFPATMNAIFESMGNLVNEAVNVLVKEEDDEYEKLSTLFTINNNLLRSIDVSHPALEKIFTIAESHGFKAKLTGAGGGGCAIILLPIDYLELNNYANLCDDLTKNHIAWKKTIVGAAGVQFKCITE